MTCQDCGSRTEVVKTMTMADTTHRWRRCACGSQFLTAETVARRLPSVTGNQGASPVTTPVTGNHRQPPPGTGGTGNPPATAGGVGGGLPSGQGSDPDLESDPRSKSEPRARERSSARASYPATFELEWSQTAKTGAKDAALRAWDKAGRPQFGEAWRRWEQSSEWKQPWYHFPHVSSWLNDGRWKQDPSEARSKPIPPADARCAFHRAPGTSRQRPPVGWIQGCPECKHAAAARSERKSDPTPLLDAMPKWAGTPATGAELESLRAAKGGGS